MKQKILMDIIAERQRQRELIAAGKILYPLEVNTTLLSEKIAVLTEELGVVSREAMEFTFSKNTEQQQAHYMALRAELVQLAACAVAWLESF